MDRTLTLVASYDGAVSRAYVDGRLAGAACCRRLTVTLAIRLAAKAGSEV